jgi:hypothetical protein
MTERAGGSLSAQLPSVRAFSFLKSTNALIAEYALDARRLVRSRPADSLTNSRKFAEYLATYVAGIEGIKFELNAEGREDNSFSSLISLLISRGVLTDRSVIAAFNDIRINGNRGAHPPKTMLGRAEISQYKSELSNMASAQLARAAQIANWFRATRYYRPSMLTRLRAFLLRQRP